MDEKAEQCSYQDDLNRAKELKADISNLETKLKSLEESTKTIREHLDGFLLKQIEILTVFVAIVSLIITNIIGIDAFGNIGIRGLIRIDLIFVISVFIILFGVKILILGFKKQ